ncbi:DUF6404 family protein [Rhodobacter sp. TJ_12]|uniref:DUF6404 family protein n=1 Tax=Rhodobacter sp. TJ_12 TaxID=2029399 RepID=UPI001CBDAC1D|nr:DUF6404 family protein [Rhodobacter sp. TJ_12]
MSDYERRLAAAQAELDGLGLKAQVPGPTTARLLRMAGHDPRPWPYLPLHLRLLAYGVPFGVVWIVVNALFGWRGILQDPSQFLASTLLGIPLYTLFMGLLERRRWCGKGLSRWEEL